MADGYEPYHVPQQSRRDKLRDQLLHHHHHHHHLVAHNQNNNSAHLLPPPLPPHLYDPPSSNFTGFISPNYMDSANSSNLPTLNPTDTSIHSQSPNPFLNFHPSRATGGALLFKPEPLSLSLSSSSHHQQQHQQQHHDGLNFQSYVLPTTSINVDGGGGDAVASRCSVDDVLPLGPFTGYASVLKGSRFLNPAQQLLEEFCDVVGGGLLFPAAGEKISPDPSLLDPPLDDVDPLSCGSEFGAESRRKKSRLISMLDEVYRRYKQYYQQMEAVVTSFECVAGLGNAAPYANLALKAMSKHFRSLKNAITDQLSKASLGKSDDHALASGTVKLGSYGISRHNGQSSGLIEHHQPVWRPQRGLPERAVTVLRAWLFEHFLHPYPTDTDKLMLAKQTGLSRSQVSNWFINARVRLWKPMVEEIHTLETRQAQKAAHKDDHQRNKSTTTDHHQQPPYSNSDAAAGGSNPSTSSQPAAFDVPIPKRTRNELPPADHMSVGSNEDHQQHQHQHQQMYNNTSNNNMQSYGGGGFSGGHLGMEAGGGGVVGGVSLTLGLHQHHHQGIGFLEPPPFSITSVAAQRFGLDTGGVSEGYNVMEGGGGGGGSGFDSSQNRHFGRDVMGGQLLHDFVG